MTDQPTPIFCPECEYKSDVNNNEINHYLEIVCKFCGHRWIPEENQTERNELPLY
jgi:DNA-directed RNA polymerase subunit RPC12/RpoP